MNKTHKALLVLLLTMMIYFPLLNSHLPKAEAANQSFDNTVNLSDSREIRYSQDNSLSGYLYSCINNVDYDITVNEHPTDHTKLQLTINSNGNIGAWTGSGLDNYIYIATRYFRINGTDYSPSSYDGNWAYYNKTNFSLDIPKRSDSTLLVEMQIVCSVYQNTGSGIHRNIGGNPTCSFSQSYALNQNPHITISTPSANQSFD